MTATRIRALLQEQDRLEERMAVISREVRTLARPYWAGKGITVQPHLARLRDAVEADCAPLDLEPTPLEYAISHGGRCFD